MDLNTFISNVYEVVKSPSKLLDLIHDVSKYLLYSSDTIKTRPPGFVEIISYEKIYAIGDLHGDFETLIEFLAKEDILENIEDGTVTVVFLGDYVDRGPQQVEVLTSILLLKKLFPDNIVLLRGNHEAAPLIIPYPHDFPDKLIEIYGVQGKEVYREVFRLFQKIPYGARIPGKILFLHGGPPISFAKAKSFEEALSIGLPSVDDHVLEEVLWNDPFDDPYHLAAPSYRGAGMLFNEKVTSATIELAGVKYIVRGHEPAEGYKIDHDGKLITLFDSRIPNYGISSAGYLAFSKEDELTDITQYIKIIS
ncbi:metallophosphoesterase [Staphylothermus marinus F1]|uniref:Metallophosphoesterase n=1 Tax=Staphylothermus marinus (strain ATCC 43588 / DSM 3639 / JCM 9404 / F1) TaxID=399550 RepID=A3DNZ4_STAMF|nr:metallophosphoesterase family protein [Staphylothermus marinus]ABN70354.1 metallophosphoesterase [Staphylothermus marinus F1]